MVDPREWLIRKDGYFYRPNCAGYTTSKFEAGRYTKAEAEREAAVEPWHMKAIHQDDVEDDPVSSRVRMDGETIASLKARISELERALAERAGGVNGEWHRADGDKSILLYTLRQDGWRKGEAVMVNDVTVRIEAANGSESPIEPIASAILSALTTEPAAPEGRQDAVEALAEFLCSEFDFDLDPITGASWPEHEKDDGYRGNGYVRLQPSDVQARARENASRILTFISQIIRPSEQAVTEAMVEAATVAWFDGEITWHRGMTPEFKAKMLSSMRSALKAAMEAGR